MHMRYLSCDLMCHKKLPLFPYVIIINGDFYADDGVQKLVFSYRQGLQKNKNKFVQLSMVLLRLA